MRTFINSSQGHKIHNIEWECKDAKAVLFITHGYAEHSLRYDHVASFFNRNNYIVRSLDFTGHGQSEGLKGYIGNFETYLEDLETGLKRSLNDYPGLPHFVLAHSMGGTVAAMAAAKKKLAGIKYLILSNPGLDIVSNQPKILVWLIRRLAVIFPKMQTTKLSNEFISRDPNIRAKYDDDPLNYRGGARPGFANEFDKAGAWVRSNAHLIEQELYLNYSMSDKVVFPKASEDFYEALSSKNKTKTEYPGLYHELLNEPEKEEVMKNILEWCELRIN